MREAFAHEAVLSLDADADERAPGAAVTVALCGHWEHEPPCLLSPHHVDSQRCADGLHIRVLFATESVNEAEVRRRIELALSGKWPFPDGFMPSWSLVESRSGVVADAELGHAERLIRG
jgi:hypothetical protein